jgi:predicted CoA-binding protein
MENKILELLKNKDVKIALIGATNDSTKYGNIIYRDLKRKKYLIYGLVLVISLFFFCLDTLVFSTGV